jgi:hypothetical protein
VAWKDLNLLLSPLLGYQVATEFRFVCFPDLSIYSAPINLVPDIRLDIHLIHRGIKTPFYAKSVA